MADLIYINVKVDNVNTLSIYINKHKTIADLFCAIRERNEMKGIRIEKMFLQGEPILESDASTLEYSGFRNNCIVHLCILVHGGGSPASKPVASKPEVSKPVASKPEVSKPEASGGSEASKPVFFRWTTTEPCCVTYDDDPEVKRAKMPCDCVIGAEALKEYCEGKVEKGWFRFPCAKCDQIWPNKAVGEALSAVIPDSEFQSFSEKLNQNYVSGFPAFKACPFCGAYVQRDPSRHYLNVSWVECSVCTKNKGSSVTFCWNCDKAWTGGKTSSCGNSGCDGKDPRIKILQECDTAKIKYLSINGVPKLRACVDCGRLLEHEKGCKHMTCRCGCEFCFVCLKKKVKVGDKMEWQCGTFMTTCSVAPRQTVIFEFQPMTKP